ncbi:MAG: Mycothiol S-conjugate amidase [Anaerolineae bacterium]|nr:Mycothiol S-conjugate amidase [Anaerolineae bacterium]
MSNKLTMMAIFAHPDDEAFGTGGTLAKYAHEGVDVHLVMATRGEAGQFANPAVTPTPPIGLRREQELRQACEHYGITHLHLLGYMDGQLALVPPAEPVFKLVRLLRQIRPQVVLSFGPEGVYGHFDHLAVHRWATAAVELAGHPERWPEAGPAYQVAKVYHRALPQPQVEQMAATTGRAAVDMGGVPFPFTGYPAEQITTTINVREYAQTKLSAIRCHLSQLQPEMPMLQDGFDPLENPWFWQETYILARVNGIPRPTCPETDFFVGVR